MLIRNGCLIMPYGVEIGDIRIENGKIIEIGSNLSADSEAVIDAQGLYVSPGFVDIHTHGGYGHDFMESTSEAFCAALKFHLDNGTTTVVPTSCTAPKNEITAFLDFSREYMMGQNPGVARVPGVHLEGPYLSVRNRGAQNVNFLATPDKDDYSYMLEYSDVIKTVTISPELSGAPEMAKKLSDAGINVSGGHDDGIYPEFLETIDAGMTHLTHHYCAMSELRFKDGVRNVGLREYALVEDRLTAELIADNKHIIKELGMMIYNAKGSDKLCVVSDSLSAAGMPMDGKAYKIGVGENAQYIKVSDGVALTAADGIFAGSITPVFKMVQNMIEWGISITDAVKMATLIPSRIIREDDKIGSIEIGKLADLCIFDKDFNIKYTVIGGTVKD